MCDAPPAPSAAETDEIIGSITPIDNPPVSTNDTFLPHCPAANRVSCLDSSGLTDNTPGGWKDGAAEPAFDLDGDTHANYVDGPV